MKDEIINIKFRVKKNQIGIRLEPIFPINPNLNKMLGIKTKRRK